MGTKTTTHAAMIFQGRVGASIDLVISSFVLLPAESNCSGPCGKGVAIKKTPDVPGVINRSSLIGIYGGFHHRSRMRDRSNVPRAKTERQHRSRSAEEQFQHNSLYGFTASMIGGCPSRAELSAALEAGLARTKVPTTVRVQRRVTAHSRSRMYIYR